MAELEQENFLRVLAERIPPLELKGGHYPVDVEATVSTGYVTYGEFVADEKGEKDERPDGS